MDTFKCWEQNSLLWPSICYYINIKVGVRQSFTVKKTQTNRKPHNKNFLHLKLQDFFKLWCNSMYWNPVRKHHQVGSLPLQHLPGHPVLLAAGDASDHFKIHLKHPKMTIKRRINWDNRLATVFLPSQTEYSCKNPKLEQMPKIKQGILDWMRWGKSYRCPTSQTQLFSILCPKH